MIGGGFRIRPRFITSPLCAVGKRAKWAKVSVSYDDCVCALGLSTESTNQNIDRHYQVLFQASYSGENERIVLGGSLFIKDYLTRVRA